MEAVGLLRSIERRGRARGLTACWPPSCSQRSVAIVGASDDPTRIGGRPLRYLLEAGFEGPIYPVNPTRLDRPGRPGLRQPVRPAAARPTW